MHTMSDHDSTPSPPLRMSSDWSLITPDPDSTLNALEADLQLLRFRLEQGHPIPDAVLNALFLARFSLWKESTGLNGRWH